MASINGKVLTEFYRAYLGSDLGDPGVEGRIILRWIFMEWDVGVWTGPRWLRIGTDGRHL
jgi:hypothetical protein